MPSIFLSYSRKDKEICEDLHKNLELQGLDVKIDVEDIPIGENIKDTITQLIDESEFSVVVVSKNSLQSTWVIWEIQRRKLLGEFNDNFKLIPVYLDKSYLEDQHVNTILETVQSDIEKLVRDAAELNNQGSPSDHLDSKKQSLFEFKNNFSKVIEDIRSTNAIDLRADNYIQGFNKLFHAIKGKTELEDSNIALPNVSKNADIGSRIEQIEILLGDDIQEAAKRTIDFVNDFYAGDKVKRKIANKACAKAKNSEKILSNGKELLDIYDELYDVILDLIYSPLSEAA